uniref:GUN4-like domain-containing protein n=1 Tax=Hommersandiophycus borowitzkae TaxID=268573 RepID=A0A1G4NTR4_9FLOR|nr:Hypothetical protein ycf53 [Hommersandiophycus borowitzkae]SCW22083.1 Hypothetical protein ycf53 [Hommersandiophycus borowitzkae]
MFNLTNIDDLDDNCKILLDMLNENDIIPQSQQSDLVYEIYDRGGEYHVQLLSILLHRYYDVSIQINSIDGLVFELLLQSNNSKVSHEMKTRLSCGIVDLKSDFDIDYLPLQKLLLSKQFQKADALTHVLFCSLSQITGNHSRNWLYFTDIMRLPSVDLHTIDQLWQIHSGGLFGLSVQKRIWLSTNSNWESFWAKIGWKVNDINCRYPQEFIWNIDAPAGHLPLFNQLRGVQVLAALFQHPAFL